MRRDRRWERLIDPAAEPRLRALERLGAVLPQETARQVAESRIYPALVRRNLGILTLGPFWREDLVAGGNNMLRVIFITATGSIVTQSATLTLGFPALVVGGLLIASSLPSAGTATLSTTVDGVNVPIAAAELNPSQQSIVWLADAETCRYIEAGQGLGARVTTSSDFAPSTVDVMAVFYVAPVWQEVDWT